MITKYFSVALYSNNEKSFKIKNLIRKNPLNYEANGKKCFIYFLLPCFFFVFVACSKQSS